MMRCRHFLCTPCYTRYLLSHLNDGSAFLRCGGGSKCPIAFLSEELIFALLSTYDYYRYRRFLQSGFAEVRRWRFCPNPTCHFVAASDDTRATVYCQCGQSYCLACGKAAHWPTACGAASAYFNSLVISDLRRKYNALVKLDLLHLDDVLTIKLKACPRCKTQFERDGGCNHIKCVKCQHHFCFICLSDWSSHGVSWYECPFGEKEVRFKQLTFQDGVAISEGDMDIIRQLCGREVDHSMVLDDLRQVLADSTRLAVLASSIIQPPTTVQFIAELLRVLVHCHSLLQSVYIELSLYKRQMAPHRLTPTTSRLLLALNQVEYFTSALDEATVTAVMDLTAVDTAATRVGTTRRRKNEAPLLQVKTVRGVRSEYQLRETEKSLVRRVRDLAAAVELFPQHRGHSERRESGGGRGRGGGERDGGGLRGRSRWGRRG